MSALRRLDELFAHCWSLVLTLLCAATGRSNFFFAKIAALLGSFSIDAVLVMGAPGDVVAWMVLVPLLLWFTIPCVILWKVASQLERVVNGGAEILPLSFLHVVDTVYRIRIVYSTLMVVQAVLGSPGFTLGNMFLVAASYFVLDFRPRKKSFLRRAMEEGKAKLVSAKLPAPAPHPVPG